MARVLRGVDPVWYYLRAVDTEQYVVPEWSDDAGRYRLGAAATTDGDAALRFQLRGATAETTPVVRPRDLSWVEVRYPTAYDTTLTLSCAWTPQQTQAAETYTDAELRAEKSVWLHAGQVYSVNKSRVMLLRGASQTRLDAEADADDLKLEDSFKLCLYHPHLGLGEWVLLQTDGRWTSTLADAGLFQFVRVPPNVVFSG